MLFSVLLASFRFLAGNHVSVRDYPTPLPLCMYLFLVHISTHLVAIAMIGFEFASYSTDEDDNFVEVCAAFMNGTIEGFQLFVGLEVLDETAISEYT